MPTLAPPPPSWSSSLEVSYLIGISLWLWYKGICAWLAAYIMRHRGDIFSLLFSDRSRARIVLLIANRERDKQVRFDEVQCEGVCLLSAFLNFLGFIWREMRMQMFRWWLLILTHDSKHYLLDTSFRNHNYSFCLLQVGKGGEMDRHTPRHPVS